MKPVKIHMLFEGSMGNKKTLRKAKSITRKEGATPDSIKAQKRSAFSRLRSNIRSDKELFKRKGENFTPERKALGKLKRGAIRIRDRYAVNSSES